MSNKQGLDLNTREKYQTSSPGANEITFEKFITPEIKNYSGTFNDPLVLNFKLMIDYDKPYGLFADEKKNINSALAYLSRIGETVRHDMLVKWIELFQDFIKNYDYLILECSGIDEIVSKKIGDMFTGEDKVTIKIRETNDMRFQTLLTTYRHIWYDNVRQVEVIPVNLRRFDVGILIYNAGYYNMGLYDSLNSNLSENEKIQTKMFPTLKKLTKGFVDNAKTYGFNHHLIILGDAQINNEESGKSFFETLTNEPSDESISNTLSLNYRFASYKGIFNNILGEFDFVKILADAAAFDSNSNKVKTNPLQKRDVNLNFDNGKDMKPSLKDYLKLVGSLGKNVAIDEFNKIKKSPGKYLEKYSGKDTAIGNAFSSVTNPALIPNMIKNTIDLGIQSLEDATVGKFVTNIDNIILRNFSDNFVDIYEKYGVSQSKNISLIENQPVSDIGLKVSDPNYVQPETQKGIRFGISNVFTRKGF